MADYDERIKKISEQIRALKLEEKQLREDIERVEQEKQEVLENKFQTKYNTSSENVRTEYINRLRKLCFPCLRGHYVKYNSLDVCAEDVIKPGASHIRLLPENYDLAKLTQKEIDAFAVIKKIILIAPKPHREHWGN